MTRKKSETAPGAIRLKPNAFVDALVADPNKPPSLKLLRGYIGRSPDKGHVRLYLDAELRYFVDVPEEGVMHARPVPQEILPFDAMYLWVRDDVSIRHRGRWAAPEDPTTMATGEEGGNPPTTMATGEEDAGLINPLDLVSNPFGDY